MIAGVYLKENQQLQKASQHSRLGMGCLYYECWDYVGMPAYARCFVSDVEDALYTSLASCYWELFLIICPYLSASIELPVASSRGSDVIVANQESFRAGPLSAQQNHERQLVFFHASPRRLSQPPCCSPFGCKCASS